MTATDEILEAARRPGVDVPSDHVWHPERVTASADGTSVAFVVPRTRSGEATRAGLWHGRSDGTPQRVSADAVATNISMSPDGSTLAYGLTEDERSTLVVRAADGSEQARVALPGVAEVVRRIDDTSYYVLIAEPGADSASLSSGKPLTADAPLVRSNRDQIGWRRVWRVDVGGALEAVTPQRLTVWSFDLFANGRIVAVAGNDPSEAGWYSASLMLLGPSADERTELHAPSWSIGATAVSPESDRVAFVEGWTSDRGLDTGDVYVLDLDSGAVSPVTVADVDVTWLRWSEDGRLWFAGWQGLGMAWGHVDPDGAVTAHAVQASIVNSRWHPEVVPTGDAALTVYSTEGAPPEVCWLRDQGAVEPWSRLNGDVERERGFVVDEVRWQAGDVELNGLLVRPAGDNGSLPLVVDIHGGPTLAYHHAWDLTWAETVVAAGYALFLPNPVGGPGHGQQFGRANLGDPAGAEFDQILAGVDALVSSGRVDRSRVAAMGASYGGYLTAWAVARGELFRGGVVIAGMSDLISCWGTANNAPFYDRLCGGSPAKARELYLDRSPITHVSGSSLPALILHGELDQCVPVSQARELFATLTAARRPASLVVYPGEGHQTQGIGHLHDQRTRILDFLAEVLG